MANILPEPVDNDDIIISSQPVKKPKKKNRNMNKRTMWVLVGLVVVAVLCLLAAFSYDYVHNKDQNNTSKQDLAYISNAINSYHSLNQTYPTLDQINSSTFSAFAPSIDRSKFMTPGSTSKNLVAEPSAGNYAYQPIPSDCNNVSVSCTGYKLIAVLNDGSEYTISSSTKN